jgi:hypothetical protein
MAKLHITQDEHDFWMLSLEKDDGTLTLLAHQFATPDKVIEMARELVDEKKVRAAIVIDPPRPTGGAVAAAAPPDDYKKPAPRKAGA